MIESFRIKNYKSIKDSSKCYVDNRVTVVAGKNEAGKTAILEALEDFNIDRGIREEAIPIHDRNLETEIELTLKIGKEDISTILEKFNIESPNLNELTIKILKLHRNTYEIDYSEPFKTLFPEKERLEKVLSELIRELKEKVTNLPIDEEYLNDQTHHMPQTNQFDNPEFVEGLSQQEIKKFDEKIKNLKESVEEYNKIKNFMVEFQEFFKQNFLPNFILFKTFEDILPDQVAISKAQNNPLIKDLSLISNIDFNKIQPSATPDEREKHKEEVNIKFSTEYEQFWTQDHSNLYFWWDSNNIYFRIKEGNELYKPEIRSKGRLWHLSFYIRVTAESIEGKNNVILIDEPGLFLHAQAQKDILEKLEECAKRSQLIYTTHSPYLIPADRLDRVRLVMKDEKKGTKIEKITAKADKETLTPILTAIGEDLSVGIRTDKKNSIVLEGYSDYLWLLAFRELLNIQDELNFIPSVGADSSVHVGSILFGWGLDPVFILDNDKKGKQVGKRLKEKLEIDEKRLIFVPEDGQGCIEDLFSQDDFKKLAKPTSNCGKVLSAYQFKQKVEEGEIKLSDLSKETKENFEGLFKKLKELIT